MVPAAALTEAQPRSTGEASRTVGAVLPAVRPGPEVASPHRLAPLPTRPVTALEVTARGAGRFPQSPADTAGPAGKGLICAQARGDNASLGLA